MRLAVYDISTGVIVNIVELEEGATWVPPSGCATVPDPEGLAEVGGIILGGVITKPPKPTRTPKIRIAAFALIERMTGAELNGLLDHTNNQVRRWLERCRMTNEVALTSDNTKSVIATLISTGVLTPERAAAVFAITLEGAEDLEIGSPKIGVPDLTVT